MAENLGDTGKGKFLTEDEIRALISSFISTQSGLMRMQSGGKSQLTGSKIQTNPGEKEGIKIFSEEYVEGGGKIADAFMEFWGDGANVARMYFKRTAAKLHIESTVDLKGNIQPKTDSLYSLGTESLKWLQIFVDNVFGPPLGNFGDGSDGDGVMDGSATIYGLSPSSNIYTATRDIFADDLTIDTGVTLKMENYRLFVRGKLDLTGTVSANGNAGGNGGDGANGTSTTGGVGGTVGIASTVVQGSLPLSIAGKVGGVGRKGRNAGGGDSDPGVPAGTAGENVVKSRGVIGVVGGAGGVAGIGNNLAGFGAGAGGGAGSISGTVYNLVNSFLAHLWLDNESGVTTHQGSAGSGSGGGGGGGGGGTAGGSGAGGGGGGGGGSGATGGNLDIFVNDLLINSGGIISCDGGAGGTGGDGGDDGGDNGGGGSGGGGGGGGSGGVLNIFYATLTNNGTIRVAGGTAGARGTNGSDGANATQASVVGTAGAVGGTGKTNTLAI